MFDVDKINKDDAKNILPILPEDMLQSYDMGKIVDRIEIAQEQGDKDTIKKYLEQMKKLTGRDKVTEEDIAKIRKEIYKSVNTESGWDKFIGFFTFINIVWMCAGCGVAISVGPCVYQCIGPYLKKCLEKVFDCLVWIFKKIIMPIIDFLHSWGVFEAFFYLFVF